MKYYCSKYGSMQVDGETKSFVVLLWSSDCEKKIYPRNSMGFQTHEV